MNITPAEFERYAQGLSTPAERAKIEHWLENEEKELAGQTGEDDKLFAVWEKLNSATSQPEPLPLVDFLPEGIRTPGLTFYTQLAACLLIVGGIAFMLFQYTGAKVNMKTVSALSGQRITVSLPDGSIVELNSKSELTYPEKFSDSIRQVSFHGEAYFTIARNEKQPFIVRTDSSYTRVLGTEFNLQAYKDGNSVLLRVEKGKVQFGRSTPVDRVILTKGMQGIMQAGEDVYADNPGDTETAAWKNNTFVIDNESLATVALRLERWFAISVNIRSEKLKALTVTGTYKNASLDKMLESFAFATGIKYTYENKVLTIYQ